MDSALTTIGLPIALAIIMFGLGLDLTMADFRRVAKHPKAVVVGHGGCVRLSETPGGGATFRVVLPRA